MRAGDSKRFGSTITAIQDLLRYHTGSGKDTDIVSEWLGREHEPGILSIYREFRQLRQRDKDKYERLLYGPEMLERRAEDPESASIMLAFERSPCVFV